LRAMTAVEAINAREGYKSVRIMSPSMRQEAIYRYFRLPKRAARKTLFAIQIPGSVCREPSPPDTFPQGCHPL
jgi:hypothetical protein